MSEKFQNAKGIRTHQASQPQQGTGRFDRSQEGREALKARGRQTYLGLPQGEEAAGLFLFIYHFYKHKSSFFNSILI